MCFEAIYHQGDLEKADELLNAGLRSNGPFYWLGAHMSSTVVACSGAASLGRSLRGGALAFFNHVAEATKGGPVLLSSEVRAKVEALQAEMASLAKTLTLKQE